MSQLALPQQAAAPTSSSAPQAAAVTASDSATLSFNRAAAVFTQPQDDSRSPIVFPDTPLGGQQPGVALSGNLAGVVEYAYAGLGRPYVWGGRSFVTGWDCSGFVQWAYGHAGIGLPRVSQWEVLTPTTTPSPGDLVTQRPDGPNHWAHVGIYVGNGMMISALNPDAGTVLHPVGPEGSSWFFTTEGESNGAVADVVAGGPLGNYAFTQAPPEIQHIPAPPVLEHVPDPTPPATLRPASVPQPDDGRDRSGTVKTPREPETDPDPKTSTKPAPKTSTKPEAPEQDKEREPDDETVQNQPGTTTEQKPPESDTTKPGKTTESDEPTGPATEPETTNPKPEAPSSPETTQPETTEPPEESAEESADPTGEPSDQPTDQPTDEPTGEPTDEPTDQPTGEPTDEPTDQPSDQPTGEPTDETTVEPSKTEDAETPQPPASSPATLQEIIAAAAVRQIGAPSDADSFIEAVLTESDYATADSGRDYLALGTTVENEQAEAGDLLYYENADGTAFAAIYLGDDVAVRGGGAGGEAVEYSLSDAASVPLVIRLNGPGQPS